ncbi:MAG: hypothetical protein NUW22_07685 [Acidobacteria bacterium]|nr:hypothetical protein [Acidobacteriota bacterium]
MEVAELRQQILREIDRARVEAGERRKNADSAHAAYAKFIVEVAGPLVVQTVNILRAEGLTLQAQTPAGAARIAADMAADDFIEFVLDTSVRPPRVLGRSSLSIGRHNVVVDEMPIAPGTPIANLQDSDLLPFLVPAVGRLAAR